MTADDLVRALQARAWYPFAGILLFLLLDVWKRLAPAAVPRIPDGYRYIPAMLAGATGGFVDAYLSGRSLAVAISMAVYGVVALAGPAMGTQGALKESPLKGGGRWGGPGGAVFALAFMLVSGTTACAPVMKALPDAVTYIEDAATGLDAIEAFVHAVFLQHPDPNAEIQVSRALAKTRLALNAGLRATQGSESLGRDERDAAFKDFRAAYDELMVLVGPLGIRASGPRMAASPGLAVPRPLVLEPGP